MAQNLMRKVENMRFRMDIESNATDSYVEMSNETAAREKDRIVITGVKSVHSTTRLAQRMRDNRGMFILSLKDVIKSEELRPCIERIKKDCRDLGYEMAMVDDTWLMMLPKDSGIELVSD